MAQKTQQMWRKLMGKCFQNKLLLLLLFVVLEACDKNYLSITKEFSNLGIKDYEKYQMLVSEDFQFFINGNGPIGGIDFYFDIKKNQKIEGVKYLQLEYNIDNNKVIKSFVPKSFRSECYNLPDLVVSDHYYFSKGKIIKIDRVINYTDEWTKEKVDSLMSSREQGFRDWLIRENVSLDSLLMDGNFNLYLEKLKSYCQSKDLFE